VIDSSTPIAGDAQAQRLAFPQELGRRFEAVAFDWDGTAVADRQANAEELRGLVERLSALGLDLLVVTGTHVGNVDSQLGARPAGPGRLMYCVNRGSEVYEADASGVRLVRRRDATEHEDSALDAAAAATVRVVESPFAGQ
jgi:hydroxymethylpyrimidine pyrophosphatase-like HAD family hydrolase